MLWNKCFWRETNFTTSVPKNNALSPETHVLHFFTCRRSPKCSETLRNIILGLMAWMLLWRNHFHNFDALNGAFTPETQVLHLFTRWKLAKFSETLPTTNFGSNRVDWMLLWGNHFRNFLHFFTSRRSAKCSETLSNIILGLRVLNGGFCYVTISATLVPRNSAFRLETHVFLLFMCGRSAKWFETPLNIILGQMVLYGCFCYETIFTTSITRNCAFRPKTQVLHHVTCRRSPNCFQTVPNFILRLIE
jgi:hypothetical protein